jgi:hypothetical protein
MGNVLRLCIPLKMRTVTVVNGRTVASDTPFIPNPDYPVAVVFSNGAQQFKLIATMRDNVACVEDCGMMPIGSYSVAVMCKDADGNPLRYKERSSVQIVGYTSDAGVDSESDVQVETQYLNAAVFLMLKGEDGKDGRGIERIDVQESQESGGVNTMTITLTDGTTTTFHVRNGVDPSWDGIVDMQFNLNSNNPVANSIVTARFNGLDDEVGQWDCSVYNEVLTLR